MFKLNIMILTSNESRPPPASFYFGLDLDYLKEAIIDEITSTWDHVRCDG